MPRTINATLDTALQKGEGIPYLLVTLKEIGASIFDTATPTYYKLEPTKLIVRYPSTSDIGGAWEPNQVEIKITRGATISGTLYTIDSSYFTVTDAQWDGYYQTLFANLLPSSKYTIAGDDTYENIITDVCAAFSKTAIFLTPAATWLTYQFYPTGQSLILRKAYDFFNILRQKRLIYSCDNGNNEILFDSYDTMPGGIDHEITMKNGDFKITSFPIRRQFVSQDENGNYTLSGNTDAPLFNLGFLPASASHPTNKVSQPPYELQRLRVDLSYLSFDLFRLTSGIASLQFLAEVTEEFDTNKFPFPWASILKNLPWGASTEGGSISPSIEAAAPFISLQTGGFNNVLSSNNNNPQSAFDVLDDHNHDELSGTYTPTRSAEANMDANVTMLQSQYMRVGNTVTVSGRFTANPTLAATLTSFEITLPIASNIGAAEDVSGVAFCGNVAGQGAEIIGVAANNTAKIQWIAGDLTSQTWSFTFTYQVI